MAPLLWFLWFTAGSAAQTPLQVFAVAGEAVVLPCSLWNRALFDDSPTVEWTRADLKPKAALVYRDNSEVFEMKHQHFEFRTSLFHSEIKDGNVSLRISDVQLSDAGMFHCLKIPMEDARVRIENSTVELVVALNPNIAVISFGDEKMVVECEAGCWQTKPQMKILDDQGRTLIGEEMQTEDLGGCSTIRQRVTLQCSAQSRRIFCRVEFPQFNQSRATQILIPVCLRISPDRSQFFQYQSFTLRCEDPLNSTDWTVKRRTLDGGVRPCSSSGSPCVIRNAFPTDSGVYWCESDDGERSNQINVTVTDLSVILESPALPVREGSAVVLHCKAENHPSHYTYDFFKDDHFIRTNTNGELIIDAASKYDEGSYTCGISGGVKSKSSWLSVSATVSPSSSAPPADSESISVFRLVVHLVVGMPYLLSTVLLGLICRDRKKEAEMVADQDQRNHVVMEIDV